MSQSLSVRVTEWQLTGDTLARLLVSRLLLPSDCSRNCYSGTDKYGNKHSNPETHRSRFSQIFRWSHSCPDVVPVLVTPLGDQRKGRRHRMVRSPALPACWYSAAIEAGEFEQWNNGVCAGKHSSEVGCVKHLSSCGPLLTRRAERDHMASMISHRSQFERHSNSKTAARTASPAKAACIAAATAAETQTPPIAFVARSFHVENTANVNRAAMTKGAPQTIREPNGYR